MIRYFFAIFRRGPGRTGFPGFRARRIAISANMTGAPSSAACINMAAANRHSGKLCFALGIRIDEDEKKGASIDDGQQGSIRQPNQPFAEINDYPLLIQAMRQRADDLSLSRENIDEIAGWADRLAGKLLSLTPIGQRRDGSRRSARRLGLETLGPMLAALGMNLVAVEDPDALERYQAQRKSRNESQVRWKGAAK
jgi:hypothetical protein